MTQLFHSWEYPENPITYQRDMCNPMFITACITIAKSCESTDKWTMKIHYAYTCIYAYTCKVNVYLYIYIHACVCIYTCIHSAYIFIFTCI